MSTTRGACYRKRKTKMPTLLDRFELDQKRRGLQDNTLILRTRQLKLYEREVGPIENATRIKIEDWLDSREISAKTRSCYLTTFSCFFRWAMKNAVLEFDPTITIERPKVHNGMPNPIPEKALERALAAAKPRMKCWLALEAYAGLRCQEVCYLEKVDIKLDEGIIHVRHGKGGRERYVPIHAKVIEALEGYEEVAGERLWPFVTPASVSQQINRYLHGLGIKHSAHKMRHRFGTKAYEASGQDILTTQRLLGHSSPTTTAIYAQVSDEAARSTVLKI